MEPKSNLRRAQSLRSVTNEHALFWTEAGLRDRRKSVSQLVTLYQNSGKSETANSVENKQKLTLQLAAMPISEAGNRVEGRSRVEDWQRWRPRPCTADSPVPSRRRSAELLPVPRHVSTRALREFFEAKVTMETRSGCQARSDPNSHNRAVSVDSMTRPGATEDAATKHNGTSLMTNHTAVSHPPMQGEAVDTNDYEKPVMALKENMSSKVSTTLRSERRKTITGLYTEKNPSQADEKRKSVTDVRDSESLCGRETSSLSVKAISALYLSKVAPGDTTGSLLKPEQDHTRPKVSKFQPVAQDMCCVCLRPVYSMEKMVADKLIFHKNCFCCKHCNRKLSVRDYAPVYGELYCIFHYQQLFRRKGNYDEGFGYQQHQSRWSVQNKNSSDVL